MDAGGAKGKAKSDINVTPLIDIVLVLLIVFIVMVPGLTKAQNVVPPQVVEHPVDQPQDQPKDIPVVVSIDKDGKFFLQSDQIDPKELKGKLVDVVRLQPLTDRKVILKVDEDVTFQQAVYALDAIKQAGDEVKKMARENPAYQGVEGSDIKVPITLKKRI
ncbi:MAG TPA: biopolymer transporter ExbD [Holophagaceae bacterium]|nr:biopolymer transporter ExbD [Holophagaceae bacterium]